MESWDSHKIAEELGKKNYGLTFSQNPEWQQLEKEVSEQSYREPTN
jgi:hypothetical protein